MLNALKTVGVVAVKIAVALVVKVFGKEELAVIAAIFSLMALAFVATIIVGL